MYYLLFRSLSITLNVGLSTHLFCFAQPVIHTLKEH
jgi:hypothetical protein